MKLYIIAAIAVLSASIANASFFKSKSVKPQPAAHINAKFNQILTLPATNDLQQLKDNLKRIREFKLELTNQADSATMKSKIDLLDAKIRALTKAFLEAEVAAKEKEAAANQVNEILTRYKHENVDDFLESLLPPNGIGQAANK